MDLHSLTAAHHNADNQLRFDPDAYDRAVLRAERRRAMFRRIRAGIAGLVARRAAQWQAWPALRRRAVPGAQGR